MKINTYDAEALKKLTKDELIYLIEKMRDMIMSELDELPEVERRKKFGEMIDKKGYGGACDLRFKFGSTCRVVADTGSGGVLSVPIGSIVRIVDVIDDDFSHFYMVNMLDSDIDIPFHDDELELIKS